MFRTKLPDRNEPLPEEAMSEITGFLDRGAAKYFHGRKEILDKFAYSVTVMVERDGTLQEFQVGMSLVALRYNPSPV